MTKAEPCAVCGRPDWCTVGARYRCCMRVQSSTPAKNGGWLHAIDGAQKVEIPSRPAPALSINYTAILREWKKDWDNPALKRLALSLGVDFSACAVLGACWAPEHRAWAWPMYDPYFNPIGIRLRDDHGRKWAVKGSRQGLFLPAVEPKETAYVCEGPTDTAAALSMGLYAVGRPSCLGCENEVARLFRRQDVRKVVIVADTDDPGFNGARKLAPALPMKSVILLPPAKDLRAFYCDGGTREDLEALASCMVWNQPRRTE